MPPFAELEQQIFVTDSSFPLSSPTPAFEPFDNRRADVILRSHDYVDFRVFKIILEQASPFFDGMFGLPTPPTESSSAGEHVGRIPVVQMEYDSATIDKLLRFCYPVPNPVLESPMEVLRICEAASKYLIVASVGPCKEALTRFAEIEPLKAYAVACKLGWEDEAKIAAAYSLTLPPESILSSELEEFDLILATTIQKLWKYHQQCRDAAISVAYESHWVHTERRPLCSAFLEESDLSSTRACAQGTINTESGIVYVRMWWAHYMESVRASIKVKAWGGAATDRAVLGKAIDEARFCAHCQSIVFEKISGFADELAAEVEKKIYEVEFDVACR